MHRATPSQDFLLGVGSTLAIGWMIQRLFSSKQDDRQQQTKDSSSSSITTKKEALMDTPDLDQRIIRKAEAVIQWRTSRITVVVERCTNDYNYSAILRTAEALGIQHVWIIDPLEPPTFEEHNDVVTTSLNRNKPVPKGLVTKDELKKRAMHHLFARNANDWLSVREFPTTADCLKELRKTGHELWVTDLSQQAVCLTREGLADESSDSNNGNAESFALPPKLAIVFGTEAVGCSEEMLEAADKRVYLPLRGFADSLNIGVATALVLHQLFTLDPTVSGDMPDEERRRLREKWFTQLCKQRLLTNKQKKQRTRLQLLIQQCEKHQKRLDNNQCLQPAEMEKLKKHEQYKNELDELERATHMKNDGDDVLSRAIRDLVDDPPSPLTDLRRADTHRVCYVGKNTKQKHQSHWKNMAAVTNYDTSAQHSSTSKYFRDRVQAASSTGGDEGEQARGFSNVETHIQCVSTCSTGP